MRNLTSNSQHNSIRSEGKMKKMNSNCSFFDWYAVIESMVKALDGNPRM